MKYLIDTHTSRWIMEDNKILTNKVRKIYLDNSNEIYLSVASIWEMAVKISLNKLSIRGQLARFIDRHAIGNNTRLLSIQPHHVFPIENLPFHHRNPFDRILLSQCIKEKMHLLSKEREFDKYGINRIW